jgi:uncharacterized protein
MWLDSDTKIAALSGAPSDIARDSINRFAGSRRMLAHFIFTPGQRTPCRPRRRRQHGQA